MHPRRESDPALVHQPVTMELIAAEEGLVRAFLGAGDTANADLVAARKAGAAMWDQDLTALGIDPPRPAKRQPRAIQPLPGRKPRNLFGGD